MAHLLQSSIAIRRNRTWVAAHSEAQSRLRTLRKHSAWNNHIQRRISRNSSEHPAQAIKLEASQARRHSRNTQCERSKQQDKRQTREPAQTRWRFVVSHTRVGVTGRAVAVCKHISVSQRAPFAVQVRKPFSSTFALSPGLGIFSFRFKVGVYLGNLIS